MNNRASRVLPAFVSSVSRSLTRPSSLPRLLMRRGASGCLTFNVIPVIRVERVLLSLTFSSCIVLYVIWDGTWQNKDSRGEESGLLRPRRAESTESAHAACCSIPARRGGAAARRARADPRASLLERYS